MMPLRNASELAKFLIKNHRCDSPQIPTTADGAVLEYINTNWAVRGGSGRIFTEDDCVPKFGVELPDVKCSFEKHGFIVHFFPQMTSGFLWWKRVEPAYLHVCIPDEDMQSVVELDPD